MKNICGFISAIILICCLGACAANTEAQWQEQYDLGVRYLSEGNYEEAIIAFTAAIEIDPDRTDAYQGATDTFLRQGRVDEAFDMLQKAVQQIQENESLTRIDFRDWILNEPIMMEELTIGGVPFYLTDIYTIQEKYPGYDGTYDEVDESHETLMFRPIYQVDENQSHGGSLQFQQRVGEGRLSSVLYNEYRDASVPQYEPEFRSVQMGERFEEVMKQLGFSQIGIEYIRSSVDSGIEGVLGDYLAIQDWKNQQQHTVYFEDKIPAISWSIFNEDEFSLNLSWWNKDGSVELILYDYNGSLDRIEMRHT